MTILIIYFEIITFFEIKWAFTAADHIVQHTGGALHFPYRDKILAQPSLQDNPKLIQNLCFSLFFSSQWTLVTIVYPPVITLKMSAYHSS